MFLSNSKWEEVIRMHSLQVEEEMMVGDDEQRIRHGRIDEESEADTGDSEANDLIEHHSSSLELPPSSLPTHLTLSDHDRHQTTWQPREKSDEELRTEVMLNELINRINAQKYTMVEPSRFDDEMQALVPNLRIMKANPHIISLQTIIRDKTVAREDFVFNADRLIRLVIEEGLNLLPFDPKIVKTPTDEEYYGVEYHKSNCGVSIVRSGEAMEKALRDCCRSIRIGKVLIQSDEETHQARVVYVKLPMDISLRKVLLLYPIMSTGNTVVKAISVLKKNGVKESNIILINLFTTPTAIKAISTRFKDVTIQTTEIHPVAPHHFGQKYFGSSEIFVTKFGYFKQETDEAS